MEEGKGFTLFTLGEKEEDKSDLSVITRYTHRQWWFMLLL